MPTNDPITTDRLIASIREGIATQPALTARARPVADRFTTLIHYRMPTITAADGDLMIHIAAFLADVMTALTAAGDADAITTATSAIAIAGLKLHDSGETPTADDDAETADAAARLRAWFEDTDGPMVMDEADFDDVLKVLAAYERGAAAQPAAEQNHGTPADLYWPFTGGADTCYLNHDDDGGYRECCMRAGLAYALKLHEQQMRADVATEQDGDVQAAAALAAADDDVELDRAVSDLIARFADRIEAREAREAEGTR